MYPNVRLLSGLVSAYYLREHLRCEVVDDHIPDGELVVDLKNFARTQHDLPEFKAVIDFPNNKKRFALF
ncbi:unnamed protein product [Allacma fusca]|uniref:Uncharacterized protein n=1 Tax=Allacma fusca TaxID=39272 RepID=A0A8J2P1M1_9HEXA|nr:unnamed protein product [Allacma fusca]